jgi:hypothetical protein
MTNLCCRKGGGMEVMMDYAIWGGDVYQINNNEVLSTCDSWFIDRQQHQEWKSYVKVSANHSMEYIDRYHFDNGDGFCYSLVFIQEIAE